MDQPYKSADVCWSLQSDCVCADCDKKLPRSRYDEIGICEKCEAIRKRTPLEDFDYADDNGYGDRGFSEPRISWG